MDARSRDVQLIEGGEIHWGDETALVNTDVRGRSYAPRGKTPVTMAVGGTRQKLSMISTVTNRGRANWMIIDGAFNHARLFEFLQALVCEGKRARRKVFLILDSQDEKAAAALRPLTLREMTKRDSCTASSTSLTWQCLWA